MKSEYRSPKSVAKNPTIPIDVNDPRLSKNAEGPTRARSGAEIQVVDFSGRSLAAVYANQVAAAPISAPPQWLTYEQITKPLDRVTVGSVSNLSVSWSGDSILFEFDFDPTIEDNKYVTEFIVHVTTTGGTSGNSPKKSFLINKENTHHSYSFTKDLNIQTLGSFFVNIANFCVIPADILGISFGQEVCVTPESFILDLNTPEIKVTAATDGYNVELLNTEELQKPSFFSIEVWEVISDASTAPSSGWQRVALSTTSPIKVSTLSLNTRWVKARLVTTYGEYTEFSIAYKVKPIAAFGVNTQPPSSAEISSVSWSGDNIVITATVSEDARSFIFRLTNSGNFIEINKGLDSSGSLTQTFTLYDADIYASFGERYTSYEGLLISLDVLGNADDGTPFIVPDKINPLANIVPTFDITAISNGYLVTYSLPQGASSAKVYASTTSGFVPSSGNLVYSGLSPAIVMDTDYLKKYVKIIYFTLSGQQSQTSLEKDITPLDPGTLSLIENPIKIATDGSIFAGTLDSNNDPVLSHARMLINKRGLFLYDDNDENGTSPTTQIIGEDNGVTATFITKKAQIADWVVSTDRIENTLHAGTTKYSGMSASGTYAFWAGGDSSGNSNGLAKFSVTPSGVLRAKEVDILGGSLNIGGTWPSTDETGSGFHVDAATGNMRANNAILRGNITATSGKFVGSMEISANQDPNTNKVGSLFSGTLTEPNTNGISEISGAGFILNKKGLAFYNDSDRKTYIVNSDDSSYSPGTLVTKQAYIGNWQVTDTEIQNVSTTQDYGSVYLRAGNNSAAAIYATTGPGTASAGILGPKDADNKIAFWAGSISNPSQITKTEGLITTPKFYVTYDGSLVARNATINGIITANEGYIGGETGWQITTNTITGNSSSVITGGSLIGSTFKTASLGSRLEIDTNGISFYKTGETFNGSIWFGSGRFSIVPPNSEGYGEIVFVDSTRTFFGSGFDTKKIQFNSNGGITVYSNNEGFQLNGGTTSSKSIRNIQVSQSSPSGGSIGDVWIKY